MDTTAKLKVNHDENMATLYQKDVETGRIDNYVPLAVPDLGSEEPRESIYRPKVFCPLTQKCCRTDCAFYSRGYGKVECKVRDALGQIARG